MTSWGIAQLSHIDSAYGAALARALAPLRIPHFPKVLIGGFIWNLCRWALGFLGAYLVNDMTGSPRLVQLTGSFMWGPLLFAGLVGGALSDRMDRKKLVLSQFIILIPLTLVVALAVRTDTMTVWGVYVFMTIAGFGWIIDMTGRRALVYDLVGFDQVNNAMALEMISSSFGLVLGTLIGGAVIGSMGLDAAYFAVALAMIVALAVLSTVPSPQAVGGTSGDARSFLRDVVDGFQALPLNRPLLSVLGITALVNFFHFAYFPITQVIADQLGASPFRTGLLASATGIGMMLGSLFVLIARPPRGRTYTAGAIAGFVIVVGFALFDSYLLAFGSLLVASFFIGWFGANQAALVMTVTDDAMRGRAMGLLSMAIGTLPIGMYLLGELAERVGASTAVVVFNMVGLALAVAWIVRRPEVLAER